MVGLFSNPSHSIRQRINDNKIPLFKLTWKYDHGRYINLPKILSPLSWVAKIIDLIGEILMEPYSDIKKVKTIYGKFYSWEGDLITDQLEKYSAHTRNELSMLRTVIKEGDNILDIGAHIGTFSIPFSVFNKRKGKVYSFEANPNNYSLLVRNIHSNNLDEVVIPTNAVVSKEGNLEFSASLPDGGNSGMFYFTTTPEDSESLVTSINIDEWHDQLTQDNHINFIKIDVEGAELLVLNSCQKIIKESKPVLYIEINRSALQKFEAARKDIENILSPLGYRFFRNIGTRNSDNDVFKIASLKNIEMGGTFFDLLAVHPSDARFPKQYMGTFSTYLYLKKRNFSVIARRFTRRLFRRW